MTKKRRDKSSLLNLFFSISLTFIIFFILIHNGKNLLFLKAKILFPLIKFISVIFITLFITSYIEAKGWITKFSDLLKPVMKFSNLSTWSISSFTSAFLSGIAANTILFNAYTDNNIKKKELFIANMLNHSIPAYLLHLPSMIAILVPILGVAGLIYISVTMISSLARGLFILFLAKFLLKNEIFLHNLQTDNLSPDDNKKKELFGTIVSNTSSRFMKIFTYTLPIYSFTVLLQEMGFFNWLQNKSANLFISFIPVEGLSVIVFSIIMEFNAGAIAAGAMLNNGVLDLKQTVLALVIGSVIATPIQSLRHQVPTYMGIYTPVLGLQLIMINQVLRIISIILIGIPFFIFFYYR